MPGEREDLAAARVQRDDAAEAAGERGDRGALDLGRDGGADGLCLARGALGEDTPPARSTPPGRPMSCVSSARSRPPRPTLASSGTPSARSSSGAVGRDRADLARRSARRRRRARRRACGRRPRRASARRASSASPRTGSRVSRVSSWPVATPGKMRLRRQSTVALSPSPVNGSVSVTRIAPNTRVRICIATTASSSSISGSAGVSRVAVASASASRCSSAKRSAETRLRASAESSRYIAGVVAARPGADVALGHVDAPITVRRALDEADAERDRRERRERGDATAPVDPASLLTRHRRAIYRGVGCAGRVPSRRQ